MTMMKSDVIHFAIDSRKVVQDSMFFALKGARVDGHDFLFEAKERGASVAVVSNDYCGSSFNLELVRHNDPQKLLMQMAKQKLLDINPTIVAITGSVAKTTTKEFLLQLLEPDTFVASKDNENTKLSLPLKILNEKRSNLYVLEMGMSEPGDIEALVDMAQPTISVLTPIGYCHAQNFSSLEHIVREKKKILKGAKKCYIHHKNSRFCPESESFYGAPNDPLFKEIASKASHLPDFYHENLHAAVLVAQSLGIKHERVLEKLPTIKGSKKRFEKITRGGVAFINDAYNASALSFEAGMAEALSYANKTKIAVVSAMAELGKHESIEHQKIFKELAKFDIVLSVDTFCENLDNAHRFCSLDLLVDHLKSIVCKGDLVYIKGSNVSKLHTIIETYFSRI